MDAGHGTLLTMTDRDPELSADVELRDTQGQLQIYEAIAVATRDAHGALDAVLRASDADTTVEHSKTGTASLSCRRLR